MRRMVFVAAIAALLAACGDDARSPCQVYAEAACDLKTKCEGGALDQCIADSTRTCSVSSPHPDDAQSADVCAAAYSDMTCDGWFDGYLGVYPWQCDPTRWQ